MSQAISGSRTARVLDRERQCWELRVRGATFDQIAHALGFRSKASAFKSYMRAFGRLKEQIQNGAEQQRALMLERLDALVGTHMPLAAQGSRDAAEIVLKADKRRADLLGFDAPAKKDMARAGQPIRFIMVEEEVTVGDEVPFEATHQTVNGGGTKN